MLLESLCPFGNEGQMLWKSIWKYFLFQAAFTPLDPAGISFRHLVRWEQIS